MERVVRQAYRLKQTCASKSVEWSELSQALKEVADAVVMLGSDHAAVKQAVHEHLVPLADAFEMMLKSLRSKLVANACEQLVRIVSAARYAFYPLANLLLPALASTAKGSSIAIREPGRRLFSHISEHSRYDLQLMCKVYRSSQQERVRILLLEQIQVVLVSWSKAKIEPFYNDLLEMMRRGMSDSSSSVRGACRDAFCSFSELWIERLNELVDVPTMQARGLLAKEKPHAAITKAIQDKYAVATTKKTKPESAKLIRQRRTEHRRRGTSEESNGENEMFMEVRQNQPRSDVSIVSSGSNRSKDKNVHFSSDPVCRFQEDDRQEKEPGHTSVGHASSDTESPPQPPRIQAERPTDEQISRAKQLLAPTTSTGDAPPPSTPRAADIKRVSRIPRPSFRRLSILPPSVVRGGSPDKPEQEKPPHLQDPESFQVHRAIECSPSSPLKSEDVPHVDDVITTNYFSCDSSMTPEDFLDGRISTPTNKRMSSVVRDDVSSEQTNTSDTKDNDFFEQIKISEESHPKAQIYPPVPSVERIKFALPDHYPPSFQSFNSSDEEPTPPAASIQSYFDANHPTVNPEGESERIPHANKNETAEQDASWKVDENAPEWDLDDRTMFESPFPHPYQEDPHAKDTTPLPESSAFQRLQALRDSLRVQREKMDEQDSFQTQSPRNALLQRPIGLMGDHSDAQNDSFLGEAVEEVPLTAGSDERDTFYTHGIVQSVEGGQKETEDVSQMYSHGVNGYSGAIQKSRDRVQSSDVIEKDFVRTKPPLTWTHEPQLKHETRRNPTQPITSHQRNARECRTTDQVFGRGAQRTEERISNRVGVHSITMRPQVLTVLNPREEGDGDRQQVSTDKAQDNRAQCERRCEEDDSGKCPPSSSTAGADSNSSVNLDRILGRSRVSGLPCERQHMKRSKLVMPELRVTRKGLTRRLVYVFCIALCALLGFAGLIQAALKVRGAHVYHRALLTRIHDIETSLGESFEAVRKMDERYAAWGEYMRKLAEQDEANAQFELETIHREVERWQDEMKRDLLEFKRSISGDIIAAALEPVRQRNETEAQTSTSSIS